MFELVVQCPCCFEWLAISLDPQGEALVVQDCDVCSRRLEIGVHWTDAGDPELQIRPAS